MAKLVLLLLLALACRAQGTDPSSQLGVMLQLDNMLPEDNVFGARAGEVEQQFALLEQAGVKWTRVGIGWEQIEAKKGQWNWSAADLIVDTAKRHGVNIVWLLGNSAPWDSNNGEWNGVPKDLDNPDGFFPRFVGQLAARYKDDIHYWEIHNEPNLEYEWHGRSPVSYASYLTLAGKTIRKVDGQAQIVFGGLGGDLPVQ